MTDSAREFARGATQLWTDGLGSDCLLSQPGSMHIRLSVDDLRWLCVVAGPAMLNELAKDSLTTLDTP